MNFESGKAIRAAVLRSAGGEMKIENVEIEEPRPGEVLIEVAACGICHTDMVMRDGHLPVPQPVVLGHEGAGHVIAVGEGVTHVAPGDPVVMSFDSCGHCHHCDDDNPAYCVEWFPRNFFGQRMDGTTGLSGEGGAIHSHVFGQSAFATHSLALARNVVKVPADLPLENLAPLGCGIQTGAGAVLRELKVREGASLLVIGAGAVGLSAVMAAGIAGAGRIIVVDRVQARLDLARELGATDVLLGGEAPLADLLAGIGLETVDYALDTSGVPALGQAAIDLLGHCGVAGIVAVYPPGTSFDLDPTFMLSGGRSLRGIVEGGSDPQNFIPELIEYHREGRFPFDKIVQTFPFESILDAIAAGESGASIKPVLIME